jgi:MoxR-like ATPase
VGYPSADAEAMILRSEKNAATVDGLAPVMSSNDLLGMIDQVKMVEVAPAIEQYVIALSQFTRSAPEVRLGVSPRGSLALLKAARATAAAAGRAFVLPDDVKAVASSVMAHRILLRPEAELEGRTNSELVARALQGVPVPRTADR